MIVNIPDIDIHLDDVVKSRKSVMAHLLPPITENYNPGLDPNALNDVEDDNSVLINVDQVKEALKNAGKDVEQFGSSLLPTFAASALGGLNRMSGQDYIGSRGTSRRSSTVSAASIFLELHSPGGSTASSPGPHRAQAAAETDFKAFKRILEAIPQQVCQHFPSQIVLKWFSTISERFSLPNLPGRKEMAPFSPPFLVLVSGP